MAESFEETCTRCGQITLVYPGDGKTYHNPTPVCDDCEEESRMVGRILDKIDDIGSKITYWESIRADAGINIENLTAVRIKLVREREVNQNETTDIKNTGTMG